MKKLLLILICLFVSFDVSGKDKLVGKKIICGQGWENLTQFTFLKDNKVISKRMGPKKEIFRRTTELLTRRHA